MEKRVIFTHLLENLKSSKDNLLDIEKFSDEYENNNFDINESFDSQNSSRQNLSASSQNSAVDIKIQEIAESLLETAKSVEQTIVHKGEIFNEQVSLLTSSINVFFDHHADQITKLEQSEKYIEEILSQLNHEIKVIQKKKELFKKDIQKLKEKHVQFINQAKEMEKIDYLTNDKNLKSEKPLNGSQTSTKTDQVEYLKAENEKLEYLIQKHHQNIRNIENKLENNRKSSKKYEIKKTEIRNELNSYRNKNQKLQKIKDFSYRIFQQNSIDSSSIILKKNIFMSIISSLTKKKLKIAKFTEENKKLSKIEKILRGKLNSLQHKISICEEQSYLLDKLQQNIFKSQSNIAKTSIAQPEIEKPLNAIYFEIKNEISKQKSIEILIEKQNSENEFNFSKTILNIQNNKRLGLNEFNEKIVNEEKFNLMKENQLEDEIKKDKEKNSLLKKEILKRIKFNYKLFAEIQKLKSKFENELKTLNINKANHQGNVDLIYKIPDTWGQNYINNLEERIQKKKKEIKERKESLMTRNSGINNVVYILKSLKLE
ncbi:hypothetical protein TRFO_36086 [Tritrichomonas foetus]|uniref:Uncharacterized protein n=1 Tax=Tritrichomonas foetus TaxID=1144522 RepID=A0A1J4JJI7_9EUKA|nr:hypothetical protein TRFO_36086 [Tritrichomonas foetus]|eukprot:OHS97683.1 hypothetical protein TRFO_36086 [Tritrichomonas foetus]